MAGLFPADLRLVTRTDTLAHRYSGKIRQLEKAGLRVSDVRNISAFLLFRASVLSCGRF